VFSVGGAPGEWDRWWAMNAPGQSESPDSAHFGDLAALWAAGKTIPLPFSDAAVRSAAEATLVLIPRR
jgi:penicillin amidase